MLRLFTAQKKILRYFDFFETKFFWEKNRITGRRKVVGTLRYSIKIQGNNERQTRKGKNKKERTRRKATTVQIKQKKKQQKKKKKKKKKKPKKNNKKQNKKKCTLPPPLISPLIVCTFNFSFSNTPPQPPFPPPLPSLCPPHLALKKLQSCNLKTKWYTFRRHLPMNESFSNAWNGLLCLLSLLRREGWTQTLMMLWPVRFGVAQCLQCPPQTH